MRKSNLRAALEAVGERCDEIVAAAEDPDKRLSDLFTLRENNHSIDLCLILANALGEAATKEVRAAKGLIVSVHERMMSANNALEERATVNPLVMSAVRCVQDLACHNLLGTDRELNDFLRMSAYVALHSVAARTVFLASLTDLRRQLRRSEKAEFEVKGAAKAIGKGPQTPFKRDQRKVFETYLKTHPFGSVSIYTRARECWRMRKSEWDKSAADGIGYSSTAALAQAISP